VRQARPSQGLILESGESNAVYMLRTFGSGRLNLNVAGHRQPGSITRLEA